MKVPSAGGSAKRIANGKGVHREVESEESRRVHDPLLRIKEYADAGEVWAASIDLEQFFDTVNQLKLIQLLGETIEDGRVISLIHLIGWQIKIKRFQRKAEISFYVQYQARSYEEILPKIDGIRTAFMWAPNITHDRADDPYVMVLVINYGDSNE